VTADASSLKGRLALVTGASRGLGRSIALALAREGAHIIAVGRTTGALEELDDEIQKVGEPATLLTLDLKKGDTIDALGPTIYQRWGKLDILVGNAGILGPLSPLPHVTADAWNQVLEINLTANWRLIRTLDPLLKHSDAGRAIFLSSGAADGHYAYWGPYAVSKA
jgi:NAD(P)-dependent dehydrogenase (short-subunit alcohol dehydrogenase family)